MNWKKILSGLLIGTFVFGVTVGNVSAASSKDKKNSDEPQLKLTQIQDSDGKNPPEPPKDKDGKILPPPDKKDSSDKNKKNSGDTKLKSTQAKDSDGKNPPEPPKDKDGNALPPPDKKDSSDKEKKSDDKTRPQQFEKDKVQQKK